MRRISSSIGMVVLVLGLTAVWCSAQRPTRESAWERLFQANPAAADDPAIGWRERLILHALTPEQADAYFRRGADPQSLLLEDGRTLEEYLDARLNPPAAGFVALPAPCSLFASDRLNGGQRYGIRVRGDDLSAQGGSATGCAIPAEATAVILQLKLTPAEPGNRVKLWAADSPEPAEAVVEATDGYDPAVLKTVVVTLAERDATEGDLLLQTALPAHTTAEVTGYFRALRAGDAPDGGVSFYTEGAVNNLFGSGAGASITSGTSNSFFGTYAGNETTWGWNNSFYGESAGRHNTSGFGNSFFGNVAGNYNTTGSSNAFFGDECGYHNTEGSWNSFFGVFSGVSNTTGSGNAFFGDQSGKLNTVGSDNAFFGSTAGFWNAASGNSFFGAAAGFYNTTGYQNTALGRESLYENTVGYRNTAVGVDALYANVDGNWNTAVGAHALEDNTTGYRNTAVGDDTLAQNTTGYHNTAIGENALYNNLDGMENTGLGKDTLYYNTSGDYNTAAGEDALFRNTTGNRNTAVGEGALQENTSGASNAAVGQNALHSSTTGYENTAIGQSALYANTTGYENTALGQNALANNMDGVKNTAVGDGALNMSTGDRNTAVGEDSLLTGTSGSYNVALGWNAGRSNTVENRNTFLGADSDGVAGMTNATAVGDRAQVSQSNSLVLGSIAGVNGAVANVGVGIGTATPSAPLHIVRSDGTALIKVEETSGTTANRVLFRLTNNGAPWFKLLNSNTAQEWTFAMDQYDNFIFSRIGTGGAEFKIYQNGEVTMGPGGSEVFDLQPSGDLEITGGLTAGGIYYASDRNRKTDIEPLDSAKVLETIAQLPVSTWRFKTEASQIRHAGPMAQDFYAAFGLGNDDKTISASDISGLALAAIQGLKRKLADVMEELARKDAAIAQLQRERETQRDEIRELATRFSEMETLKQAITELQARLTPGKNRPAGTGATE